MTGLLQIFAVFLPKWQQERNETPKIGKELRKAQRNNLTDKQKVDDLLNNGVPPNFRDSDETRILHIL